MRTDFPSSMPNSRTGLQQQPTAAAKHHRTEQGWAKRKEVNVEQKTLFTAFARLLQSDVRAKKLLSMYGGK